MPVPAGVAVPRQVKVTVSPILGLALLAVSPVHAIEEMGEGDGFGVETSDGLGFGLAAIHPTPDLHV
jgi:hypothetical protein